MPMDPVDEVVTQLRDAYNVLLYGPPGTGKTFLMQEVVRRMSGGEGGYWPWIPRARPNLSSKLPQSV